MPRRSSPSGMEGASEALDFIRRPVGVASNRAPMLRVDIVSGMILVNRLGEVMGDVFASYSRGSVFNERGG